MRHRLTAALTAALILTSIATAPAALAGVCTTLPGGGLACGRVWSHTASAGWLQITNQWPPTSSSVRTLYAGQASTRHFTDTDGFRVKPGCNGWAGLPNNPPMYAGGTWYKINDLTSITIRVTC